MKKGFPQLIVILILALLSACASSQETANTRAGDIGIELASLYLAEGDYEGALAVYDRALEISPSNPQLRYNRTSTLLLMGRYSEAAEDAAELFETYPAYIRFKVLEAAAKEADGDINGALAAYEEAVALNPYDSETRLSYARLLERAGRREEALDEATFIYESRVPDADLLYFIYTLTGDEEYLRASEILSPPEPEQTDAPDEEISQENTVEAPAEAIE